MLSHRHQSSRWQHLQETIAFVRTTRPDDIGIALSYPIPATTRATDIISIHHLTGTTGV